MNKNRFISALIFLQMTLIQGAWIEQQTCSSSGVIPSQFEMATYYAPSLVTCSFLCKGNPSCRTYSYSGKLCRLYWSSATTTATFPSRITCKNSREVCPKLLNNEYSCSLFAQENTCYCISLAEMSRVTADISCAKYGMKLLSVETSAENAFVRNLIITSKVQSWCVWTSGIGRAYRLFTWNSTGKAVDININLSDYVDYWLPGYCLLYSSATPMEPWRWDDVECSNNCINICEFVPPN